MLGDNHFLPLLHMAKRFLCIHETNELIDDFSIRYMINPTLHGSKSFKDKVEKCMNNKS